MIKEPVCFDPRRRLAALVAAAVFSLTALSPMSLQAQAERSPYHVSRYNIEVELEPDVHQLRVRARLTVVADEPLASLKGEFVVVPKGVEHMPVAKEEVWVVLLEPKSTLNTGNVRNERTLQILERI